MAWPNVAIGMKVQETASWALVLMVVVMVLGGCTGSSEGALPATSVPDESSVPQETVVETATAAVPTPEPSAQVSDQERIDSVVAQFAVDVAAGDIPSVFAYDLLDSKIDDDGDVTLTICAWAGDSVFDRVRDSIYRTRVGEDGAVTATHVTTPLAAGECLNTQLIESALETIDAFDEFVADAGADPTIFDDDPRRNLLSDDFVSSSTDFYQNLVDDGVYFEGLRSSDSLVDAAVADLLWRRLTANGISIFEVAVCRDMVESHGMYRDGVLVDDERSPASPGLHSIHSFQLVQDPTSPGGWLVSGQKSIIWSDCFFADTWPEGANIFKSRDTPFEILDR